MSEQLVTPENVTTKDGKINLLDLNRQQMREFFKDLGEKPLPRRSGDEVDVSLLLRQL